MSTLKTDTIVGTGENNEVTFINNKMTGTASGSITLPAEGGTVTTNLQQGLTKYWISFEGRSTVSTHDSFNHSTLTDNGTGDFSVTRTNPMNNLTYANGAMSDFDSGDSRVVTVTSNQGSAARTTTAMRHALQDCQANGHDPDHFSVLIFGDLA